MTALSMAVHTSMQLIRRIVTSAGHRLKWSRLGVHKLRSAFHLDSVVICGRRVKIAYPPWDVSPSEAEWQTLEDIHAWGCVKYPALECRLDVQAEHTLPVLIDHLQRLRFAIVHFREDSYPNVELIHAKNRSLVTEGATS